MRSKMTAAQQIADINARTAAHQLEIRQNMVTDVAVFLGMTPRGVVETGSFETVILLHREAQEMMKTGLREPALRALTLASAFYRVFGIDPIPADSIR